jgi:hypothetical protein
MTFNDYQGTAEQYIRQYLDPSGTLDKSPTSYVESVALWEDLEEVFADEGGTGISLGSFCVAVNNMQGHFESVLSFDPQPKAEQTEEDLKIS